MKLDDDEPQQHAQTEEDAKGQADAPQQDSLQARVIELSEGLGEGGEQWVND